MQSDCEIYVDPEEDEVFFGCFSEREKTVSAKLVNCAVSGSSPERKSKEVLDECNSVNVEEEEVEIVSKNEQSGGTPEEILIDSTIDLTEAPSELKNSFQKDSSKILSNNTSVELEHNYSTPMKHKIDKSILTTPKSVVKADRDGGFLKVLSEIALVKAEAEGDKKSAHQGQDEDKENQLISTLPEIKITEATPEKGSVYSPPKSINTELRRFRIIYNSPQNEENSVECSKGKSHVDNFENERNFINKCLDQDAEVLGKDKRKSVELIDFNECANSGDLNEELIIEKRAEVVSSQATESNKNEKSVEGIPEKCDPCKPVQPLTPFVAKKPPSLRFSKEARKIVEVLKKSSADDTLNFTIPEIDVEEEENSFLSPEPVSAFDETVIPNKAAEVQPEKVSPKVLTKPADNKIEMKAKTVEKERVRLTPTASQSKLQPLKYFSERRIYNQNGSEAKSRCAKKLPLEDKRPVTEGKVNGGRAAESGAAVTSRIPVFGVKHSKIPLTDRARTPLAKTTPSKTPSGKSYKNPKFNHIESPINAYIHNKPTSLVVNVKPEVKKDCPNKVWKSQAPESEKKIQEKQSKLRNPNSAVKLPFVEYKSTTAYKVEKRPESRLPRLAPSVMKLIGTHSPKVLKHEGRFYVNTPRKHTPTENSTIVADPNEVSVVVSQPVQKSNTIK